MNRFIFFVTLLRDHGRMDITQDPSAANCCISKQFVEVFIIADSKTYMPRGYSCKKVFTSTTVTYC